MLQAALYLQSSLPLEDTAQPLGDSLLVLAASLTTTKWWRDHGQSSEFAKDHSAKQGGHPGGGADSSPSQGQSHSERLITGGAAGREVPAPAQLMQASP